MTTRDCVRLIIPATKSLCSFYCSAHATCNETGIKIEEQKRRRFSTSTLRDQNSIVAFMHLSALLRHHFSSSRACCDR